MKMDAASIAQKAASEQDFFFALLKNPKQALEKFNIETDHADFRSIDAEMLKLRTTISDVLLALGSEKEGGSWGLGGTCCNA